MTEVLSDTELRARYDTLTDSDLIGLHDVRLSEAITQRLRSLQLSETQRWIGELREQGLLGVPSGDDVAKQLRDLSWTVFGNGFVERWNGDIWISIPRHLDAYLRLLLEKQNLLLAEAYAPICWALHDGRLLATGVLEPEVENGWRRDSISQEIFRIGRYSVHHNGSRLAVLRRDGVPEVTYNAVMLVVPDTRENAEGNRLTCPQGEPLFNPPDSIAESVSFEARVPRCSAAEARRWYRERVAWYLADPERGQPTREQDEEVGRNLGISRAIVRELRQELAPTNWAQPGRRLRRGS